MHKENEEKTKKTEVTHEARYMEEIKQDQNKEENALRKRRTGYIFRDR